MRELLYRRIAEEIREEIRSGKLVPGLRMPGVRELAARWNTSINTVLKALTELESEGFVNKRQGQGIFVETESSWKIPAEREIELLVYNIKEPLNIMLMSSVEKAAADYGYKLAVRSCSGTELHIEERETTGRIVIPGIAPVFTGAYKSAALICIGDFNPPENFCCSYAVADVYGGFCRTVQSLLSLGRERIAYIGASGNIEDEPGWNACRDVLSGTPIRIYV